MSKFNCQHVMTEAWTIYRRETRMSRPTLLKGRRKLFARCLRTAWAWAKQRLADSQLTLQQRASARIQELTMELMRIDARPFGMRIGVDHRSIQSEIDAISNQLRGRHEAI